MVLDKIEQMILLHGGVGGYFLQSFLFQSPAKPLANIRYCGSLTHDFCTTMSSPPDNVMKTR